MMGRRGGEIKEMANGGCVALEVPWRDKDNVTVWTCRRTGTYAS